MKWLAVGVVVGAIASGAIAQAADKYDNRPFSGATTGTTSATPNADTGQVDSTSTGNLIATHVGNSTYTIEASQDYARHQEEEHVVGNCGFVEDGATNGLTITAANGDQIFGNIDDDRSVVCAPDSQTGGPQVGDAYYSTLYIRVSGGTGRFSDATGWLFLEGTSTLTGADPNTGSATFDDAGTMLGDIDY
jgi:hypothetical protein